MKHFFTLVFGGESFVTRVEVQDPENGTWLPVVGFAIDPDASPIEEVPVLSRPDTGIRILGNWMTLISELDPIPQILAGVFGGDSPYLESEVLTLCTAAEGLHRRLHPEERRICQSDVNEAKVFLKEDMGLIPNDVREAFRSALGHLHEPGFATRMQGLAEGIAPVTRQVTGKVNRWKKAVTEARNALAHSLAVKGAPSSDHMSSYVLAQSLRWLLLVTLLMKSDVDPDRLIRRIGEARSFEQFVRMSKEVHPDIYSASS
jgi:hypothetical protein